ncbi:nucleotidyltransferase family protein [Magnetococcales bacterium HHB-1]
MDIRKIKQYRKEIIALAERYGAKNVRIFGAIVRGKKVAVQNDIGFIVSMKENSQDAQEGLSQELEQLLKKSVTLVCEERLHWYVSSKIQSEALPLSL